MKKAFGEAHYLSLVHLLTHLFTEPSFHPTPNPHLTNTGVPGAAPGAVPE